MRKRSLILVAIGMMLAMLACNAPGGEEATLPFSATTPPAVGEQSPIPPDTTPGATDTPAPDIPGPGGCTLNAAFVSDVTVPDDTQMSPGESFVKTWRVRNSGTCDWDAGTTLVFSSGRQMGGPDSVPVGALATGETLDVSVNLTAPDSPGSYRGDWQLQAPDGTRFGSILYLRIIVPSPATDTPTPTRTPNPTSSPTATPDVCVEVDPALEPILERAQSLGYDIGCPTEEAFTTWGALQQFWRNIENVNPHTHLRSLMLWREDNREIYVIVGQDTDASEGGLLAYTDMWEEGQPEVPPACAGMTVPDGYQLPVRGFGRVWCNNDLVDDIGWPDISETGADFLVQPTQFGLLMRAPVAPIGYMIALDYRAMHAVTMMISP